MKKNRLSRLGQALSAAGERFLRLGEVGQTESEADRIRAVRLSTVMHNTPLMMGANIANALIALVAFANSELFAWVAAWALLIIVIAAYTGLAAWRNNTLPPRQTASLRGSRNAIVFAALLSGLWAALTVLFYPHATDQQRLVIVAITVGMMGGGGFALATIPPAAITFSGLMGLVSLLALIVKTEAVSFSMLGLYVIYTAIIVRSSLALCENLTIRVRAQMASDEQRDVIGLLLNDFEENAADWLWGLDPDLRLKRASPRLFEELGCTEEHAYDRFLWELLPCDGSSCGGSYKLNGTDGLRKLLTSRASFRDVEVCVVQEGEPGVWSLSAKAMFDADGNFTGYRGVGRNVTQAREARRRIEHMARHDSLTNVGNRVLLNEGLARAIDRLERFDEHFSILLLDLDRFKQVNDTHGHGAGDQLLREVARVLQSVCGETDTLARLGGDEFAVIHTSMQDPRAVAGLADRLVNALSQTFPLASGTARIGASIGIACAPIDGRDADTLMRHADLALYRAKADGRNRFHFFDTSLDAAARRRNLIEQELRAAVATRSLTLHFQPLVDSKSGQVVCAEALLRWHHPTLGAISPTEFIPVAEDIGLIDTIGAWVIGQGCRTAAAWPPSVRVAVNLSPRQFAGNGLYAGIASALRDSGLPPSRLELEVTESLLLKTNALVKSTLAAITALGVRVALDDFGTGYSSLSYLRKYRFDKLKIDQSFISDIETDTDSRAIVDAIIRLGHDLGMSVAAEGVETEAQYDILRNLGCGEIQGYLVGRPMPGEELERILANARQPGTIRHTA